MIEFICIYLYMVFCTTIAAFNPDDPYPKKEAIACFLVGLLWPFTLTIWLITIIFINSRK